MELQNLPIYKLWLVKISSAVYEWPEAQYQEAMQNRDSYMKKAGGKELLVAQTDWSNEEYDWFGIEEFPNLDALLAYQDSLREIHWTANLQSKTYLGWSITPEFKPVPLDLAAMTAKPGTKPIYKVALFRQRPQYYDEMEKMNAINDQINAAAVKSGVESLMGAYVRPNNEEWLAFLLERYPNLDALGEKYQVMDSLGWFKYVEAKSFLGTATSGIISGLES